MSSTDQETDVVVLPDGRRLAYLQLGAPDGLPVVHAHGAPSGRLETLFFDLDTAARDAGVRLLAFDRPGVGGSDPLPGRSLLGWGDDVAAAADALDIGPYGLLGYSVGAASALACRHRSPSRVLATAIVSGTAPVTVPHVTDGRSPDVARVFRMAVRAPALTALMLRFMRFGTRTPARMITASARGMPLADRAVAERASAAEPFAAFLADALRPGPAGVRDDMRLAALPWGFTPSPGSPTALWHGTADTNVPVAAAHWLAGVLPDARLTLVDGGGHVSVLDERAHEVLQWLAATIRAG